MRRAGLVALTACALVIASHARLWGESDVLRNAAALSTLTRIEVEIDVWRDVRGNRPPPDWPSQEAIVRRVETIADDRLKFHSVPFSKFEGSESATPRLRISLSLAEGDPGTCYMYVRLCVLEKADVTVARPNPSPELRQATVASWMSRPALHLARDLRNLEECFSAADKVLAAEVDAFGDAYRAANDAR